MMPFYKKNFVFKNISIHIRQNLLQDFKTNSLLLILRTASRLCNVKYRLNFALIKNIKNHFYL